MYLCQLKNVTLIITCVNGVKNGLKMLKKNMNLTNTLEDKMNDLLYNVGLGLAIALLVCLFPMPYGYYTIVRFTAMIIFGCMAFCFYKDEKIPLCVIVGSLAVLFQPFFKIALGRTVWNVIDVIVAIALVLLWIRNRK